MWGDGWRPEHKAPPAENRKTGLRICTRAVHLHPWRNRVAASSQTARPERDGRNARCGMALDEIKASRVPPPHDGPVDGRGRRGATANGQATRHSRRKVAKMSCVRGAKHGRFGHSGTAQQCGPHRRKPQDRSKTRGGAHYVAWRTASSHRRSLGSAPRRRTATDTQNTQHTQTWGDGGGPGEKGVASGLAQRARGTGICGHSCATQPRWPSGREP